MRRHLGLSGTVSLHTRTTMGLVGAYIPPSQGMGPRSRPGAGVWWLLGWVALGELLTLSEPQFSPFLLTCRPGWAGGAGLVTCEGQTAVTSGPPPLSHLL